MVSLLLKGTSRFRCNTHCHPDGVFIRDIPAYFKPHCAHITPKSFQSKRWGYYTGLPAVETPIANMWHHKGHRLLRNNKLYRARMGHNFTFKLELSLSSLPKCLLSVAKRKCDVTQWKAFPIPGCLEHGIKFRMSACLQKNNKVHQSEHKYANHSCFWKQGGKTPTSFYKLICFHTKCAGMWQLKKKVLGKCNSRKRCPIFCLSSSLSLWVINVHMLMH